MKPKIALVTGASSGIGLELAKQFASGGWELHLVARRRDLLEQLADELKTPTTIHVADLTDAHARQELIESLQDVEISCLVNNAGFGDYAPFAQSSWPKIEAMLRLNIEALTHLTHAFLPGMIGRGRGKILNVASTASFFPGPGMATYYASKAFVLSFSEALSTEVEGKRRERDMFVSRRHDERIPSACGTGKVEANGRDDDEFRASRAGRLQSDFARTTFGYSRRDECVSGVVATCHEPQIRGTFSE